MNHNVLRNQRIVEAYASNRDISNIEAFDEIRGVYYAELFGSPVVLKIAERTLDRDARWFYQHVGSEAKALDVVGGNKFPMKLLYEEGRVCDLIKGDKPLFRNNTNPLRALVKEYVPGFPLSFSENVSKYLDPLVDFVIEMNGEGIAGFDLVPVSGKYRNILYEDHTEKISLFDAGNLVIGKSSPGFDYALKDDEMFLKHVLMNSINLR